MSEEEIRAAYPDCAEAVLAYERLAGMERTWWGVRTGVAPNPPDPIACFVRAAENPRPFFPGERVLTPLVSQMKTPGFRRYVAAKLGMM